MYVNIFFHHQLSAKHNNFNTIYGKNAANDYLKQTKVCVWRLCI